MLPNRLGINLQSSGYVPVFTAENL